jgi:succinoglycan biosynthesis protein ExoM
MRIAICICTCGRAQPLGQLLDTLSNIELGALDTSETFFVVVDNRPDGRAQAVCERAARLPCPLHFVEEPERGISFARNRAVSTALARGADFIAFIDDDDRPRPDWLAHLVSRQRATGADLVLGIWQLPDNLSIPESLRGFEFFKSRDLDDTNRWGFPYWAATCNVLIGRRVVERLGQVGPVFRQEFALTGGEDTDFFIRARIAGFSVAVAAESVVFLDWGGARLTLRGALRRTFRLGSTSMHLDRAHMPAWHCERRRRAARSELVRLTKRWPRLLFKPKKLGRRLPKIAWSLGVLYGHAGRSYKYYG